jgi:hypothetical protein
MKYYMGHFGQAEVSPQVMTPINTPVNISYNQDSTLVTTVSDIASKSLDTTFEKASQIATSQEVQDFIKEHGLQPFIKDLNRERVKNILALLGFIWIGKIIKSPVGLASLGFLGLYVVYSNKDKLIENVSQKVTIG